MIFSVFLSLTHRALCYLTACGGRVSSEEPRARISPRHCWDTMTSQCTEVEFPRVWWQSAEAEEWISYRYEATVTRTENMPMQFLCHPIQGIRLLAVLGFFFFVAKSQFQTESASGFCFVFLSLSLFFFFLKTGWSPSLTAELATQQQNNFAAVTVALMCPLWGSPRRNCSVFLLGRHS